MTLDWKTEREIIVIALSMLHTALVRKNDPQDATLLEQVREVRRTYGVLP